MLWGKSRRFGLKALGASITLLMTFTALWIVPQPVPSSDFEDYLGLAGSRQALRSSAQQRRLLVLDQLFGGGEGRYASANDIVFQVIRANKKDIELAGKGDPESVEALRSGAGQLTKWELPPVSPSALRTIDAVVTLSFGELGHCANEALSWLTGNQFVGNNDSLDPLTPVFVAPLIAETLPRHVNLTDLTTVPADVSFDDIARALPKAVSVLESQLAGAPGPASGQGASILVIVHPDQAVRAAKMIEGRGHTVNVPNYIGMPWAAFGCDENGYGPSTLPRLANRATYIRHELMMRAVQVYDGDISF